MSHELDIKIEIMRAAGIEDEEILLLAGLKHRVSIGDCTEVTPEYKRLEFYRFLVETYRISEWDQDLPLDDVNPIFYHPSEASWRSKFV